MKIKAIEIENYKNFEEKILMTFNEDVNFIIGENNLGKSNLLRIFNKIFNSRTYEMFKETDFFNKEKEILIILTLKLDKEEELGIFEDNFNFEKDYTEIRIQLRQEIDEDVEIICLDSGSEIKLKELNRFNLFYLDSAKNNNNHLDFDKKIDVNSTLNLLLEHSLKDIKENVNEDLENIKDFDKVKELLETLNKYFCKLHVPSNHNVIVDYNDLENIVSKIFMLKEKSGIDFKKSGEGLKSLLYLELVILNRLFYLKKKERLSSRFDNILLVDEPEIHLHTYKQRSFIKYLINNFKFDSESENNEFKELVGEIFNIDEFQRQIFIVTHSPNILTNDYKQIIRFYKYKSKIFVVSGEEIEIDEKKEIKHFLKFESELKEAFFSKGIIICEGNTEIGLFKSFFEKLKLDSDNLGVSIVQAGSCSTVPILKKIFDKFKINTIGFRDKDNLSPENIIELESHNVKFTEEKDSEEDFVKYLNESHFKNKVIEEEIFTGIHHFIKTNPSYTINLEEVKKQMKNNKNIYFGYKCGNCLDQVIPSYNFIILEIKKQIRENE